MSVHLYKEIFHKRENDFELNFKNSNRFDNAKITAIIKDLIPKKNNFEEFKTQDFSYQSIKLPSSLIPKLKKDNLSLKLKKLNLLLFYKEKSTTYLEFPEMHQTIIRIGLITVGVLGVLTLGLMAPLPKKPVHIPLEQPSSAVALASSSVAYPGSLPHLRRKLILTFPDSKDVNNQNSVVSYKNDSEFTKRVLLDNFEEKRSQEKINHMLNNSSTSSLIASQYLTSNETSYKNETLQVGEAVPATIMQAERIFKNMFNFMYDSRNNPIMKVVGASAVYAGMKYFRLV